MTTQQRCPSPTKVGYDKLADAARAVTEVQTRYAKIGRPTAVHPHKCQCGRLHLTQAPRLQGRQLRRARRNYTRRSQW